MAEAKVDFMVFGASGYTGQYVVEILAKTAKEEGVTWAVAGRHVDRIKTVLSTVSSYTGIDLDHIKAFKADVSDYESLVEMCKASKIVLNCVGPYHWFGEPVVKACIETGTDHLDVSGEPNFQERIQLLYHDLAKEKKVYLIVACGFGSIPCEMGTVFLNDKFGSDSELNSVEQHVNLGSNDSTNSATWDSVVNSLALKEELAETRQKIADKFYPKKNPTPKYKLQSRGILSKNDRRGTWDLVFPSTDEPVFDCTQKEMFQQNNKRPCQFKSYIEIDSIVLAFFLFIVMLFMTLMVPFKFTRNLLHKYPELFSLGMFKKGGPEREQIMNSGEFEMRLIGKGWKEKTSEPTDQHAAAPDKKVSVLVKGPHYGYITTPIAMIQSGLMVLRQKDKLPNEGGVYTPGVAFRNTNLIEQLRKNKFTFEVEE